MLLEPLGLNLRIINNCLSQKPQRKLISNKIAMQVLTKSTNHQQEVTEKAMLLSKRLWQILKHKKGHQKIKDSSQNKIAERETSKKVKV